MMPSGLCRRCGCRLLPYEALGVCEPCWLSPTRDEDDEPEPEPPDDHDDPHAYPGDLDYDLDRYADEYEARLERRGGGRW